MGQNAQMDSAGMRSAESLTRRMVDKYASRGPHPCHDIPNGPDGKGRNALSFDKIGDETHGLVTPGSVGNEDGQVGARSGQLLSQVRGQFLLDLPVELNTTVD